MKKLLLMLMMITVISSSSSLANDKLINLVIDEKNIVTDVEPVIVNDRTLVPLRVISEELGSIVGWNDNLKEVTLNFKDPNLVIKMKIGNKNYSVDGKVNSMDVAPQIINERTMVPIRFISETLGQKIKWDDTTRTVSIYTKNYDENEPRYLEVTLVE